MTFFNYNIFQIESFSLLPSPFILFLIINLYNDFIKGKDLPKASDINKISLEIPEDEKEFYIEGESFKTLVSLDMMKYVNECKSATVRKNVTIPSWLNEMGKSHNLNFSNLLQEAIKKELDIE